jgi:hypothetical protein
MRFPYFVFYVFAEMQVTKQNRVYMDFLSVVRRVMNFPSRKENRLSEDGAVLLAHCVSEMTALGNMALIHGNAESIRICRSTKSLAGGQVVAVSVCNVSYS